MRIIEDLDYRSERLVPTPSAFVKSCLLYVQYIGHYFTNPGYSIEREKLDLFLLLYTLNGKGELFYEGKLYRLSKGMVFLIDCREYHMYRTNPQDLWEFKWVHFDGNTSMDYVEHFMKLGGSVVEMEVGSNVEESIKTIRELQKNMDERSDLLSSQIIVDLLTAVLLSATNGKGQDERILAYIRQVKISLEQRMDTSFSLDDLTREFAISKYHLSREFKKYKGYSPYEYLVNLRIKTAKELLKTLDLTVKERYWRSPNQCKSTIRVTLSGRCLDVEAGL